MMEDVRTTRVLTRPQIRLLVAMFRASPTRVHHVHDMGSRLPVLNALVRKGYAVRSTSWRSNAAWRARLTSVGRREAKLLEHLAE